MVTNGVGDTGLNVCVLGGGVVIRVGVVLEDGVGGILRAQAVKRIKLWDIS